MYYLAPASENKQALQLQHNGEESKVIQPHECTLNVCHTVYELVVSCHSACAHMYNKQPISTKPRCASTRSDCNFLSGLQQLDAWLAHTPVHEHVPENERERALACVIVLL